MKYTENIIQIYQRNIREADLAFAEFMKMTETHLNNLAIREDNFFKGCDGLMLEKHTENILKEISSATPFRAEDIKLISGAKFPDIQAGKYYGVEVKSTKTDTWTSTGSSIIESTRIPDITKIYMLFGKLGGSHAEFKCKPYEACLSNIAVTHSPRYLIDMTLSENQNLSIFDKMQIEYETFRKLDDKEKIKFVRKYFKEIANKNASNQKKFETPWWISDEKSEESSSMLIRFYSDIESSLQEEIKTKMLILFSELFRFGYQQKYKRAALWMCSRYSIIDNCMRDRFSAGGKTHTIGNIKFENPVPQIINTLYQHRNLIYNTLTSPTETLCEDIGDYWETIITQKSLYTQWLDNIQKEFSSNPELNKLDIRELFEKWETPTK